jgi:two-component system NtrC family sensor kinase
MAEVATSVLHKVGNVLNSVNVSATLLFENTKKSSVLNLAKAPALLNEHDGDLAIYLTTDPKGKQLPFYLAQVGDQLSKEQQRTAEELESLRQNIEHIKEIVAMPQDYARVSGLAETVTVTDLVEDALRMNAGALARHEVTLLREFAGEPLVAVKLRGDLAANRARSSRTFSLGQWQIQNKCRAAAGAFAVGGQMDSASGRQCFTGYATPDN